MTQVAFQTGMRQAAVDLLTGYAVASDIGLQVYPALPTTFKPPTAFVERMDERTTFLSAWQRQRTVAVQVVLLYRLFAEGERADAAVQRDAFVDGFSDYVFTRFHQVGATEMISAARFDDEPEYVVSDPKRGQVTYFAVRITLEGYTGN